MDSTLSIGAVARETGVSAKTIRFYEAAGALPSPARTASGYRMYGAADVRRLRLLRNARMLGLSVPEAGEFVRQAFASDCSTFGPELMQLIASKRADVRQRIASLHALHDELEALERHVGHADCVAQDGQVANCGYRPLIDGEGTACCGEDTSST